MTWSKRCLMMPSRQSFVRGMAALARPLWWACWDAQAVRTQTCGASRLPMTSWLQSTPSSVASALPRTKESKCKKEG